MLCAALGVVAVVAVLVVVVIMDVAVAVVVAGAVAGVVAVAVAAAVPGVCCCDPYTIIFIYTIIETVLSTFSIKYFSG